MIANRKRIECITLKSTLYLEEAWGDIYLEEA